MPTVAKLLVDEVLAKLDDTASDAHSRALVLRVMNHAQAAVSNREVGYRRQIPFTPLSMRGFYPLETIATDAIRVLAIYDAERTLSMEPYRELVQYEPGWAYRQGMQHSVWSQPSLDLLVLWPLVRTPVALTVSYLATPTELVSESQELSLSSQYDRAVVDMTRGLLALRARRYPPAEAAA